MLTFEQYISEIELGDYNLEHKYQTFNHQLFGGTLPSIPITWESKLKKASGRVLFTPMNFGFSVKPGSVRMEISSIFKSSEERLDGIMVHEMIHVYFLAVKNDGRESHGPGFMKKVEELQHHVSFQIPVSDDITDLELTDKVRTSEVAAVIRKKDGEVYVAFFGKTLWQKYGEQYMKSFLRRETPNDRYSFFYGRTNLHRKYTVISSRSSTVSWMGVTAQDGESIETMPKLAPPVSTAA